MPYSKTKELLPNPTMPNQRGPTCGLYALEGVICALYPETLYRATKDHKNPDITKRTRDDYSLRHIAKNWKPKPLTVVGEIFDANHFVKLVDYINKHPSSAIDQTAATENLEVNVITASKWKTDIQRAIDSDNYIIAPFGVNDTLGPQLGQPKTGGGAHYCLIYAYAFWSKPAPTKKFLMPFTNEWWNPGDDESVLRSYVMVRHWGKNYRFYIDEFHKSSQTLKKWPKQYLYKKEGTTKLEHKKVKLLGQKFSIFRPSSAKKIPAANLPRTLADKLVIVGRKTTK